MFTCCLGRLRPGSEVTRVQPAILGDSCPVPSARSINQQSQASRAQFRRPAGSTSCAWRLGPVNEGPWCRPDFQGDSGPAQRCAVLSSSHGRLGPGSECPRSLPAALGDSGPPPKSRGVDQLSQATWALARAPLCSNSYPLRPWTESEGTQFDQLSQVTWAHVGGFPDLTSCPGGLRPGSKGPRGRPSLPGVLGPAPNSRGFNKETRATWAHVRVPAGSTSSPG